jgi:hypothetical protein
MDSEHKWQSTDASEIPTEILALARRARAARLEVVDYILELAATEARKLIEKTTDDRK